MLVALKGQTVIRYLNNIVFAPRHVLTNDADS